MIIVAHRARRVPAWYVRHVIRMVQRLIAGNPGFHRLVIRIENTPVLHETGYLVNPDIEPEVRRLLGRVLVLAAPIHDEHPWTRL